MTMPTKLQLSPGNKGEQMSEPNTGPANGLADRHDQQVCSSQAAQNGLLQTRSRQQKHPTTCASWDQLVTLLRSRLAGQGLHLPEVFVCAHFHTPSHSMTGLPCDQSQLCRKQQAAAGRACP